MLILIKLGRMHSSLTHGILLCASESVRRFYLWIILVSTSAKLRTINMTNLRIHICKFAILLTIVTMMTILCMNNVPLWLCRCDDGYASNIRYMIAIALSYCPKGFSSAVCVLTQMCSLRELVRMNDACLECCSSFFGCAYLRTLIVGTSTNTSVLNVGSQLFSQWKWISTHWVKGASFYMWLRCLLHMELHRSADYSGGGKITSRLGCYSPCFNMCVCFRAQICSHLVKSAIFALDSFGMVPRPLG